MLPSSSDDDIVKKFNLNTSGSIKANEARFIVLQNDKAFMNLLEKAYLKFQAKSGDAEAQNVTRDFVVTACWICNPKFNVAHGQGKPEQGDVAKELLAISKAALKLAKQIKGIAPSFVGVDSDLYLKERLQAGNPVGYILKRKNSWRNATRQQPSDRLSELLQCFASDIEEEAALLGISIASRRQKGGKQAGLHFAMDGLTRASIPLSTSTPAMPNFALVNSIIAALLNPQNGFDSSTARQRYLAAERRKTRV